MSSLDLKILLNDLKFLVDGRIDKVYQDGKIRRLEVFLSGKGTFEFVPHYEQSADVP